MRFDITQNYAASPEEVTAAYADEDLYPTLVGLPKLGGIEVIDRQADGPTARLRIRFRFTGHLPSAVTTVIDPDKLTWIQETQHDLEAGTTTFRLVPDHYPDRLKASGTFRIEADGDGSRRLVEGELEVRALLVAGRVEAAIVGGLREFLGAEAPAVDVYLGH